MPATVIHGRDSVKEPVMTVVMIGIDPHKGSHTAAAIGPGEEPLGQVQVRASASQAGQLIEWAAGWPERTWAAEGATGLGHLLAQQLVAAGEAVPGRPAETGGPGAVARGREHRQERRQ